MNDYADVNTTYGYGGGYNRDSNELVGGVALTVPLGGTIQANCDTIVEMEEARTKVELAVTLYEAGSITKEQLQQILDNSTTVLLK